MSEQDRIEAAKEAFKTKAREMNISVRGYSIAALIWNNELDQLLRAALAAADRARKDHSHDEELLRDADAFADKLKGKSGHRIVIGLVEKVRDLRFSLEATNYLEQIRKPAADRVEGEGCRQVIRDAVEALERGSSTAPVVEALKSVLARLPAVAPVLPSHAELSSAIRKMGIHSISTADPDLIAAAMLKLIREAQQCPSSATQSPTNQSGTGSSSSAGR